MAADRMSWTTRILNSQWTWGISEPDHLSIISLWMELASYSVQWCVKQTSMIRISNKQSIAFEVLAYHAHIRVFQSSPDPTIQLRDGTSSLHWQTTSRGPMYLSRKGSSSDGTTALHQLIFESSSMIFVIAVVLECGSWESPVQSTLSSQNIR